MSAIEMARRVCAEHDHNKAYQYLDGSRDDYPTMKIALAAISETQRLDAQLIEMIGTKYDRTGVPVLRKSNRVAAVAIRKGEHYYG